MGIFIFQNYLTLKSLLLESRKTKAFRQFFNNLKKISTWVILVHWRKVGKCRFKRKEYSEFPGGPVVWTQHFHCHGPGVQSLVEGTKIPQASWPEKKKKSIRITYDPIILRNPLITRLYSFPDFFYANRILYFLKYKWDHIIYADSFNNNTTSTSCQVNNYF